MKYLFLDNSNISNKRLSINSLGGFMIDVDDYIKLSTSFRKLKLKYNLKKDTPVKWSPDSRDPRYTEYRNLKELNKFRTECLNLISNSKIKVVCCFINNNLEDFKKLMKLKEITKKEYKKQDLYYQKCALEYVAQRFQKELETTNDYGQIIIEFINDSSTNSSMGEFYRDIQTNGSGKPFFSLKLKNLGDSLMFSHDFCCDGIEIADFIISSLTHALKNNRYHYVDIIKNKIRNRSGFSKGYGVVVYPSASVFADNLIKRIDSK